MHTRAGGGQQQATSQEAASPPTTPLPVISRPVTTQLVTCLPRTPHPPCHPLPACHPPSPSPAPPGSPRSRLSLELPGQASRGGGTGEGRRRPQVWSQPRDPVGPPLQLWHPQHRHGNLSAATTFPNIPHPTHHRPQALLLAELRLRRVLSDSRTCSEGGTPNSWLAWPSCPPWTSVTPSAKWRGLGRGGSCGGQSPFPAWMYLTVASQPVKPEGGGRGYKRTEFLGSSTCLPWSSPEARPLAQAHTAKEEEQAARERTYQLEPQMPCIVTQGDGGVLSLASPPSCFIYKTQAPRPSTAAVLPLQGHRPQRRKGGASPERGAWDPRLPPPLAGAG